MTTTNLISTPGISGNIGSCKSESVEVTSARLSIWKEEATSIVTNSCTGQVSTYTTWNYTPTTFFGGIFTVIIVIAVCSSIKCVFGNPRNY